MVDITSISAVVAAIGVIVGAVFAVLQLRGLVRTRQTDLVIRLYSTYGSKEFQEAWAKLMSTEFMDYDDLVKKYGSPFSERPGPIATVMVGMYFEGIGVFLRRKLVNVKLIQHLFFLPVKVTWEKMKSIIEGVRKQLNLPAATFASFEYLYNELKKREQTLQSIQ